MAKFQNIIVILMCIALASLAAFGIGEVQPDYFTNGFMTHGINLSAVASEVLPGPVYIFFMVCGAMFALISTLNAQYAWATKPILQACDDGWLPQKLAFLHPKYKTPVVLLAILYGLAVISVAADISMSMLGNLSLIALSLTGLMVSVNMWKLPRIVPDAWNRSKFKVCPGVMKVLVVLCVLGSLFNIYMNLTQLSTALRIGNVVVVIFAVIFALVRGDKVEMDISYEEK